MNSKAPKKKKTALEKVSKKKAVKKKAAKKTVAAKTAKPKKSAANPVKSKSKAPKKSEVATKPKIPAGAKPATKRSKKTAVKAATKKPAKPAAKTSPLKTPKSPAKVLRPKSFEQIPAAKNHGFPEHIPELPENYLRDRLVLMTQEPDYLFSYWEITTSQLTRKSGEKRKGEQYSEALKLNWPARSLFDQGFVILPVSLSARRWYLQVPFPGLSYQVEIGWLSSKGEFISILASNESEAPESWTETQRRLRDLGSEVLSRAASVSRPSGSSEHVLVEEIILASLNWKPGSASSSSSR